MSPEVFIHPSSDVQTTQVGAGTKIWQYVVVLKGANIGKNCNINALCFIENDVSIGDNVTLKSGVQLWDGVSLEDNVFIGPNATFTNDLVPRSKQYPERMNRTIVKKGASIGANATLLSNITIGEYAFVGAGSVITHDIPPHSVWYGNPARMRGYITRRGVLLDMDKKDKAGTTVDLED